MNSDLLPVTSVLFLFLVFSMSHVRMSSRTPATANEISEYLSRLVLPTAGQNFHHFTSFKIIYY